jgi:hypothetical protein
MSDHLDAPGLKSPNMDAKIDITDIYAFQNPQDAQRTILILNVNPLAPTLANSFEENAIYELLIDNNGDAVPEIAYQMTFSPLTNGSQTATVNLATGADAAAMAVGGTVIVKDAPVSFTANHTITNTNGYNFFAGIRSDPFFFDLMGFLAGLKFTGADFFADKNVFGIVLDVPNSDFGPNSKIGVWSRVLMPDAAGKLSQADRMGRPAINTVFNHGEDKNTFNHITPAEDRATFLDKFVATLTSLGNPPDAAKAIAMVLLPDILTYDYSSPAGFLNGRKLADDVIDAELSLVTNGAVKTDMVGPHTDLLPVFPYMGNPHGIPLSARAVEDTGRLRRGTEIPV